MNRIPPTVGRILLIIVLIVAGIALVGSLLGQFAYIFQTVEEQEVGIQFQGGRIVEVVGPGVYTDFGLFVRLERISTQAVTFQVRDEEMITKDKQRIGLVVSGDIFRPGLAQKDELQGAWSQYRGVFTDDETARLRVQDLARQSMKVCIGDRTFDDNVVGTARDELRQCIDDELNELASQLSLRVENLVVPEVILSPEVQAALDQIVQSRLATEKAAQDELKAKAESAADQARQEGEIRVEQSRIQEQTRQQITLAQLEQERLQAQLVIIEAERANEIAQLEKENALIASRKANELLAAEQDLAINRALADAAVERARAEVARELALAELYAANPDYLQLQIVQANANAISPTDKLIFTPEGTIPTLVLPGPGIVPTVDTGATGTNETAVPAPEPAPETEESP
ncbi:MAG: SPFH domain-containing protein [Chloroflexota bacterium]